MIINSSTVGMFSERTAQSYVRTQSLSVEMKSDVAATLDLSEEGKSYLTQLEDELKEREKEQNLQREKNQRDSMKRMMENMKNQRLKQKENFPDIRQEEDLEVQMLRQMLKALRNARNGNYRRVEMELEEIQAASRHRAKLFSFNGGGFQAASSSLSVSQSVASSQSISVVDFSTPGATNGSMWTRITASETTFTESEYTSFSTVGTAVTADGREINFNVELAMSRACSGSMSSLTMEEYFVTDPLIVNLDSSRATVTDQKFVFDLDADGMTEEISFAGEGSGFLALDKNNDGIINDGNELFGTKSGDGFKDLAAYDKDGNGWIDEADDIFSKLKIWTKDENGKDKLISLKDAGVGAMYLGNADTQFHLKNDANQTNGIIQKTGIFLKETGEVGTMQHVDLVV